MVGAPHYWHTQLRKGEIPFDLEIIPSLFLQAVHQFHPVWRVPDNLHPNFLPILISILQAQILSLETDISMVAGDDSWLVI